MLIAKWADKPNLAELRKAVKKIEEKKPLTWRDIAFADRSDVSFDFNGKMYRVDADAILNIMGRTVTDYRICGGYDTPIYEQINYEVTIRDIADNILKEWLMEHFKMWEEVPE